MPSLIEMPAAAGMPATAEKTTPVVGGISFAIEPGEFVGFLGPNGAGKTTTLKMLSGLLHPTAGEATVHGYVPWRRDRDYLGQMTLIMGQRNQLAWDIPVMDSFELNRAIFRIPWDDFRTRRDELIDLADVPLHGRCRSALSAGDRHPSRHAALRRRSAGSHPPLLALEDDHDRLRGRGIPR
jgi:ABC-2 type transport system ATP-binding protein